MAAQFRIYSRTLAAAWRGAPPPASRLAQWRLYARGTRAFAFGRWGDELAATADLVVNDATHDHAGQSVALVAGSVLSTDDAAHAHASDNLGLTSSAALALVDALHAHDAGGIVLTIDSALAVESALHDQAADGVVLLAGETLAIADASQEQVAGSAQLTSSAWLLVADALHGHAAAGVILAIPSTGGAADPADVWNYVLSNGLTAEETAVQTHAMLTALTAALASCPDTLGLVLKLLRNKQVTNPATGTMTVFDDDSVTPLLQGNLFEDAAGTQAYRGQGAERRERLA